MSRIYRTGDGRWAASEREIRALARKHATDWQAVQIEISLKGVLAFLNAGQHLADVPKLQAIEGDVGERAAVAIEAYAAGSAEIDINALQQHLRSQHRIEVSALWIGDRLQRLGWSRRLSNGTTWVPGDPTGSRELTYTDPEPVA